MKRILIHIQAFMPRVDLHAEGITLNYNTKEDLDEDLQDLDEVVTATIPKSTPFHTT